MTVRAFYRAAKVENAQPPYDTIYLKVIYPAQMSGSELESNLGIVSADEQQAPFPIVIFFGGFNCSAEIYQWLAVKLAETGLVVIIFNWVAEDLPGMVSLTPGIDLKAWNPEIYGTKPTASALPTLLQELEYLQTEGILAGKLDLEKIVLGGHSAGGRVAIENANPDFFPQVVAGFAYAAHTLGGINFGYQPGEVLPLSNSIPLLLMGGTCDGVISSSSQRYGISYEDATTPIISTFERAIAETRNDRYLVLIEGANHFSLAYPCDSTEGRIFLDFPATQPEVEIRALIAEVVSRFIDTHVRNQTDQTLAKLLNTAHPLIKFYARK
jgi:predicted dienelactone hydrolase